MDPEQPEDRWVDSPLTAGSDYAGRLQHLDGRSWTDVPPPPRVHAHRAQTRGTLDDGRSVERCPCGAGRFDGDTWEYATIEEERNPRIRPEPVPRRVWAWLRRWA